MKIEGIIVTDLELLDWLETCFDHGGEVKFILPHGTKIETTTTWGVTHVMTTATWLVLWQRPDEPNKET